MGVAGPAVWAQTECPWLGKNPSLSTPPGMGCHGNASLPGQVCATTGVFETVRHQGQTQPACTRPFLPQCTRPFHPKRTLPTLVPPAPLSYHPGSRCPQIPGPGAVSVRRTPTTQWPATASSPLALVGRLLRLLQLLQGRGQALLSPVQLLLHQLDASVESCHIAFGLREDRGAG